MPENAPSCSTRTRPLDRHRGFDGTCAPAARIFANQGNDDVAIYNASEEALRGVDLGGCARRVAYAAGRPRLLVRLSEGVIFAGAEPLLETAELSPIGPHNADNAMAAAAAAGRWASSATRCGRACAPSPAFAHRLERVAEIGACSTSTTRRRPTWGSPRRAPFVRSRRAGDPRRLAEGRRLQGAGGAGQRALRCLLPDRRRRRPAGAGSGARP